MLNLADLTTTIKSIPWFLDLSPESIQRLSLIGDIRSFDQDDILFSEGEQHPNFYIILDGKIQLESYVPGRGPLPLLVAESLDVIGWSSLTPVVRQMTSTARALESTRLLCFNSETLMEVCESDCDLGFTIMRRLANIIASRLLTHRLHLLSLISNQDS